jgi:hypothetical protein
MVVLRRHPYYYEEYYLIVNLEIDRYLFKTIKIIVDNKQ